MSGLSAPARDGGMGGRALSLAVCVRDRVREGKTAGADRGGLESSLSGGRSRMSMDEMESFPEERCRDTRKGSSSLLCGGAGEGVARGRSARERRARS